MKDKFIKLTSQEDEPIYVRKKLICYFCKIHNSNPALTHVSFNKGHSSFSVKETPNDIDFILNEKFDARQY